MDKIKYVDFRVAWSAYKDEMNKRGPGPNDGINLHVGGENLYCYTLPGYINYTYKVARNNMSQWRNHIYYIRRFGYPWQ